MKISLAKSAGFCFGVKKALSTAFKAVKAEKTVYMLGDIVHNEDVVRNIKKAGIKTIKSLKQGKGNALLIRAHGTPSSTLAKAKKLGYKIIDATCPMVKEIHKIAKKSEKDGYRIIIIGDKKHDEVKGIAGQLTRKAIVIDDVKNIHLREIKRVKKGTIVVQSTQDLDNAIKIIDILKKYIKELKFHNTICRPTKTKQQEIKILPLENDIMIIIGSKTSANTKRLYQISKSLNKNSFWVQSKKDLKPEWFKNTRSAGITSGASTPDSITQDIVKYIEKIT